MRLFTVRLPAVLGTCLLVSLPLLDTSAPVHAADLARSDQDCAQLLERWATDPKAAPKRAVDACKKQLAAIAPAAGSPGDEAARAQPAAVASLDPCSGPDAASSVLCWGPWSRLAPAAAAPLVALNLPDVAVECDLISDLANQCVPKLEPVLPIEGCQPGTPCGFATIVSGVTSTGDAETTEFGAFRLASDGSDFTVSPRTGDTSDGPIDSVPMTTIVTPRPDGYGNLRASGRDGDVNSRLIARVEQDDDGDVQLAADVWTHGTRENARSGYFAWGIATSQAGLDTLNAGNVSINFAGPMSVNNATVGTMTVNFGSNPTWIGTWTNPAWRFGAGGPVTGVNLVSAPGQFSSNVTGPGSYVQGALVGEAGGPRGITHIIDVKLEGQGRIKDVGLLRDVIATPGVAP
ncbi:MAG: hypothetical protein ABI567_09895 [Gammaproteobacteria bacterium]